MRFLHTSDWHLGRQFHSASLLDDQRHVLEQLVALAVRERVDAVLLAGDIYDRAVPPAEAVTLFDDVVDALQRADIRLVAIAGNHDSGVRIGFGARQLARSGVHLVGPLAASDEPVRLRDAHGEVCVHALPFADPWQVRDHLGEDALPPVQRGHDEAMAALLARRARGARNVLLAHCFVDGSGGDAALESESERPLSIGGAERVSPARFEGFDYVALGHLHAPQQRGRASVRYSGSLLKYSFSESTHAKSVALVEMDGQGACDIRLVPLAPRRDVRIVEGKLAQLLEGDGTGSNDDYLLVRLHDTHAILDVMSKLRAVYPNVLHVERVVAARDVPPTPGEPRPSRGELALVQDFWREFRTDDWTEAHARCVADALSAVRASGDPGGEGR
jgi:exonuclease SbcD